MRSLAASCSAATSRVTAILSCPSGAGRSSQASSRPQVSHRRARRPHPSFALIPPPIPWSLRRGPNDPVASAAGEGGVYSGRAGGRASGGRGAGDDGGVTVRTMVRTSAARHPSALSRGVTPPGLGRAFGQRRIHRRLLVSSHALRRRLRRNGKTESRPCKNLNLKLRASLAKTCKISIFFRVFIVCCKIFSCSIGEFFSSLFLDAKLCKTTP